MLPYFQLTDIHIGTWVIRTWGIFVSLAFVIGLWQALREAKRRQLATEPVIDVTIWIMIAAMAGGRVFYIMNEWPWYRNDIVSWFKIWDGGLAMYGGLIGGVIAAGLYFWYRHLPKAAYFDVLAYVMPLAIAVGRVGCFLIHDHLGRATTFILGVKIPDGTVRHDLALYEILFGMVLFIFFHWWRRKNIPAGLMTVVFIIVYGFFRFGFDFLRATDLPMADPTIWPGIHPSQYAAGLSVLIAAVWLLINHPKHN
ncbi:MAG: prolipoprotein diacylglyceryl transferase family protein [Patescibacteria group bacterium]|jgi:phosphatidylglycerol:prolipoprotein diacylglycerol transferase